MKKSAFLFMMRLLCFFLGALFLSCESVDIFKSKQAIEPSLINTSVPTEPFLIVTKIANTSLIPEKVVVYPQGYAVVYQHKKYIEKRTFLSAERIQQIRDLFIHTNIINITDNAAPRQSNNSIRYEVYLANESIIHFTITAEEHLPKNIKELIVGIEKIIEDIIYDGLQIELIVPQNKIMANDTLLLKLKVANTSDKELLLEFSSAQQFDFYIYNSSCCEDSAQQWHWGAEKSFAQAIQYRTIPPQSSIFYQTKYLICREKEKILSGPVYVVGMCLSTPGGTTRELPVYLY